eukprot:gnl/MRDRNA2_/MRDRNA2_90431_c0_seq1.p1 gnl/MRDRNA2_/MRDRNA2_90431_c0~~gnl/MRDRNA2_/MRDRNA2_90431_c0_seq1.p1  ORF type:complete len:468 (+),score=105.78 gnl/MRDRNA2_/MRDRNA2_90431_c0_seq1:92-1495(+)
MASVEQTIKAINDACHAKGGVYKEYSCKSVSWDDVARGTVGGALSCWGANITDTRLWAKDGRQLFTVRSDNWNEKLGAVSVSDVAIVTGNHVPGGDNDLRPVTLRDVLANMATYGGYAGLPAGSDLSHVDLDKKVSIRFQTTFLPVGEEELASMEFCSEAYNYNTMSDADPRNLILLCTTQGVAVQQDGRGAQKLFHHAVDGAGKIHRYWLEAERSRHKVGGPQVETEEERIAAAARGKATSSVIGVRAMGTRFNVLMNIQVPLEQAPKPMRSMAKACKKKKSGGFLSGFSFGSKSKKMALELDVDGCEADAMEDYSEEEDDLMEECMSLEANAMPRCRSMRRSSPAPKVGSACAARVSRGSEYDTWNGLTAKTPKRNPSEHVTCTVVIYNAVSGGVPSEADVIAAIDDLEQLYAACSTKGNLADQQFDFMKKELTVKDANDIAGKISTQPYKPPVQSVAGFNAFPL